MRRITIRGLMGLVLGLAVAIAALRNADDYWAGGLLLATALVIGVAALGAVYHSDRRRAGRLGFAVFGGGYFALVFMGLSEPNLNRLPTTWLLRYFNEKVAPTPIFLTGDIVSPAAERRHVPREQPRSHPLGAKGPHGLAEPLEVDASWRGKLRRLQRRWALPVRPAGRAAGNRHRTEVPGKARFSPDRPITETL